MSRQWIGLFQELKKECDWLSFRFLNEDSKAYSTRDGKVEEARQVFDRGVMMEVVVDGTLVYAATSDLSEAGLRACFKRGAMRAKQLSPLKLTHFNPKSRGLYQAQKANLGEKKLEQLTTSEIVQHQIKVGELLKKGPHVLSSQLTTILLSTETLYLTSDGAEIHQETAMTLQDMRVTGQKKATIQTRSDHGYMARSKQGGAEGINTDFLGMRADTLIRELNEMLDAPDCPTGKLDLLLSPDQMMLQIHESIGHPLEIDRILGDERNYAGWSFVKKEDFGKLQYGSPLMNVSFDPDLKGEIASYAYDDSGTEAQKTYLIQEGKLLAGLGGSESQERSGLAGVSNFRAQSWNRAPIDRMANLNLEPGSSSLDEMIAQTERGIYMQTNRSWSIDDFRNKFQFGCEYARLIEDGKLTSVVKNPNYRGTTVAYWNALKAVGDPSTFEVYGTPHCGKGEPNQVIRVGHASPACLFSQIEVFGGA